MKNFTNNFKQFTSRLSARWLIMALMLLLGTSNVWSAYYATGPAVGNGSWGDGNWVEMTGSGNKYTCPVKNTGEFKITSGAGWGDNYKLNEISCNDPNDQYNGNVQCDGANNHYANVTGTLCFDPTSNSNKGYMWIESSSTPTGKTFYLVGDNVTLFKDAWNTKVDDNILDRQGDTYTYIKTYSNITFNNETTIKYKITAGSWGNSEYSCSDQDCSYVIPSGKWNITFTATSSDNGQTISNCTVSYDAVCSAPTSVSITKLPETNPCPGTGITLGSEVVGTGDVDSYTWSVTGTGWSIQENVNKNASCIFIVGTGKGTISLKVNGCNTDVDASINIEVKSKPTKSDYTLQSSVEYGNGAPSITPKQGFPVPTTIKYGTTLANATTTAPTAVGTYNVYITTEATNTYCAVSNLDLGTYTITCKTPTTALDLSKEDIVKCGDDVLVPGTITVNNYSAYNSENVFYLDNTEYTYTTIGDNGGKIGGINTSKEYTVSVAKKCGTSYSEKKSTNITIVSSDVKKTPTLASTPIVKCGTSYNPGELKITNYDANYNYTINPTVDAPTINGNIATYVINGNSEIEYTVTATHKTYNTCSSPVTQKVTITDNSATIAAETDINQNFCTGDVITLTVTAGQGTYNWVSTNGGQVISQKTNSVTVTQSGTYIVTATNASGCVSNEVVFSVTDSGVMIHASGETTLGANKFAALYVTDCSGREIETYQWEYCSPESSKYVNYTASVSNSGTLYSGDAGTTNNIRPSDAGFYRCTVTYKGGGTATSAAEEVTGTYSYLESNIPIIVVNTNGVGFPDCPSTGGTASKNADVLKEKRSVDVKIYDGTTLVYDRKARMNYRGSSSLNFQKKSYAFCPGKDNCVEDKGRQDYVKTEKMNMLGVGSAVDKDWVLYASAADPTLMRNRLVFDTYKAMRPDDWSVQSRYVELIVDGEHKGVYVLMDKITKNDNRVKLNEENGFIVKFDKTDCADRFGGYNNIWGDEKTFKTTYTGHDYVSTYDTHIDQRFEIEYPEKDDYTIGWSSKVKSIQAMFQAFEDALKAGEYATVQKYIDYDSWADWFIINEYTKNVDAYRASCIFVYTGEEGAKIEARPLWDQELSFNNNCPNYMTGYGSNDATGFLIQESKVYEKTDKHIAAPFWFTGGGTDITGGLLSDPCFVQIVKEKWSKYSTGSGPLTEGVLKAKIGEYTTELGAAKNREAEYWKTHSRSTLSCPWDNNTTGYSNTVVTTSLTNMETWFASRGTGLTNAINGLTGSSLSIEIMPYTQNVTPWTSANVAIIVKPEGYDYKLEYIGENDLSSVANAIIEQEGDNITYRIPRPAEWGTGDAVEGERANIEYIIKATLNVQERTSVCGSQAAPTSTAIIKLIDEKNDNCPQP